MSNLGILDLRNNEFNPHNNNNHQIFSEINTKGVSNIYEDLI